MALEISQVLPGVSAMGKTYKVMGLAPYGKPAFMDAMRKIVRLKPDGA
jgi:carbamoyltransferase